MAEDSYPLSEFPFYEIKNWNRHQHPNADCGKYFAVKSEVLRIHKIQTLTNAEFGLLVRLWAYRSTGLNPPRAPSRVAVGTGQARTKHLVRQLKTLERRGFLVPTKTERPRNRRGILEDRIGEERIEDPPNPPSPTAPRPKRVASKSYPEYSPGFLQFWAAYPKRVGKGAAWKAWAKIKCEQVVVEIIAAVNAQIGCDQWERDGGQFIPNPATWLNQTRWQDEVEVRKIERMDITPEKSDEELAESAKELVRTRGWTMEQALEAVRHMV